MEYINAIETYLVGLQDLLGEDFHVGPLNNREDIGEGLLKLSRYANHHTTNSFLCPRQFGRKGGEMPVRKFDCVGRTYL